MSWWTEVIITMSNLENTAAEDQEPLYLAIDAINSWLAKNSYGKIYQIKSPDLGHEINNTFQGKFRTIGASLIAEKIKEQHWEWPSQVQMFARQEDDMGFREVPLDVRAKKCA